MQRVAFLITFDQKTAWKVISSSCKNQLKYVLRNYRNQILNIAEFHQNVENVLENLKDNTLNLNLPKQKNNYGLQAHLNELEYYQNYFILVLQKLKLIHYVDSLQKVIYCQSLLIFSFDS